MCFDDLHVYSYSGIEEGRGDQVPTHRKILRNLFTKTAPPYLCLRYPDNHYKRIFCVALFQ